MGESPKTVCPPQMAEYTPILENFGHPGLPGDFFARPQCIAEKPEFRDNCQRYGQCLLLPILERFNKIIDQGGGEPQE